MDHDGYNERRWNTADMSDDDLRKELRIRRKEVRKALEREDFLAWKEAVEWVEVINDEIAYRKDPGEIDE